MTGKWLSKRIWSRLKDTSNREQMSFHSTRRVEFVRRENLLKSKPRVHAKWKLSRLLRKTMGGLSSAVWHNRMSGRGYHAQSYVSYRVDLVLADNSSDFSSLSLSLPPLFFSLSLSLLPPCMFPFQLSVPFRWWNQFQLVRHQLATPFPRLLYVARILRKYIEMFSGN